MKCFSQREFENLIDGATVLQPSRHGPKMYETKDGQVVKLFRVKRLLSSNLLSPFAVRFARNAARLIELGIPCVRVTQVAKVPHLPRQMVVYEKLPGEPLRHVVCEAGEQAGEIMRQMGGFVSFVQDRGVYFRSFHFGNVLVMDNGAFGLIDVLDINFYKRPLDVRQRQRNFRHMTRYPEDREVFAAHWPAFQDGYTEALLGGNSRIGSQQAEELLEWRERVSRVRDEAGA